MNFEIDLVEDIAGEIEEMMRLCTLGHFSDAQIQFGGIIEREDDIFPVKLECMRMFYEQGAYRNLRLYIVRHFDDLWKRYQEYEMGPWLAKVKGPSQIYNDEADEEGMNMTVIVERMKLIASEDEPGPSLGFDRFLERWDFSNEYLEARSSGFDKPEKSVIFVLGLEVDSLIRRSNESRSENKTLQHLSFGNILLYAVREFLEDGNLWAAEQVLKHVFRDIELPASKAWGTIVDFVEDSSLNHDQTAVIGQINLIQTFCEAILSEGTDRLAASSGILVRALATATERERIVLRLIDGESWRLTRTRIRRELLKYDLQHTRIVDIFYQVSWNDYLVFSNSAPRSMEELRDAARQMGDERCWRAILWRMASLTLETPACGPADSFISETLYPDISPSRLSKLHLERREGQTAETNYIRLLSIDGGGVRGLSALLLLEHIVNLANDRLVRAGKEPQEPWQMFDMIGGTNTGGLIAIMLGRLRMSIKDCKGAYLQLSAEAFTKKRVFTHLKKDMTVSERYDTAPLQNAIERIIGENWDTEVLMDDQDTSRVSKAFVVAHSLEDSTPVLLRSYYNNTRRKFTLDTMLMWEAARATLAGLSFFDDIVIQGRRYSDGGLLYSNPVQLLEAEASEIFPEHTQLIVSLGAGRISSETRETSLSTVAKDLIALATENEKTADYFHRKDGARAAAAGRYFRFNVPEIIGHRSSESKPSESEPEDLRNTEIRTTEYVTHEEIAIRIERCSEKLIEGVLDSSETIPSSVS